MGSPDTELEEEGIALEVFVAELDEKVDSEPTLLSEVVLGAVAVTLSDAVLAIEVVFSPAAELKDDTVLEPSVVLFATVGLLAPELVGALEIEEARRWLSVHTTSRGRVACYGTRRR